MATYSLDTLTGRMQGKSVTRGWDAVVFMDRTKVNSLLEQQYITRFQRDSFLKRIFGAVKMTPDGDEVLELSGLILSQPRLSFAKASLRNSRVTATLDIVSGTVSYLRKSDSQSPDSILYSYTVSANQGFTLTMDIDLSQSQGTVNEQGRVIVDMGAGYDCRCNLVNEAKAQELLGNFFKALFLEQKPEDRVYELGMLDLLDVDLLAPRSFQIRTMATDEGTARSPDYDGDGAVVLLVRTKGNPSEGDDVSTGAFDYLIPNDRDPETNKALYSGALVLASRVLFDWYLQDFLQNIIGNNLRFERLSESNHISRTLRAIAGDFKIPGFQVHWDSSPHGKWVEGVGPLAINMYSRSDSESLKVRVEESLLEVVWDRDVPLPFHIHMNEIFPIKDEHIYYDALVTTAVKVRYRPVLEAGANKVFFDLEPGHSLAMQGRWDPIDRPGIISAWAKKLVGERTIDPIKNELATVLRTLDIPEINVLAISNLLFPERNALQLTQARLPGDLAMFGHIDPKETTFTLDPLLPVIKAGEKQTFSIRQLGHRAAEVKWTVRGVDGSRAQGTIEGDAATAEYVAPDALLLNGNAVRNVVTATYTDPTTNKEVTASALVVVCWLAWW
jgi:hypothetical protein